MEVKEHIALIWFSLLVVFGLSLSAILYTTMKPEREVVVNHVQVDRQELFNDCYERLFDDVKIRSMVTRERYSKQFTRTCLEVVGENDKIN